jgi:surface antigen
MSLTGVALLIPSTNPAEAVTSYLCHGYSACQSAGYGNLGYQSNARTSFWRMTPGHNCTNYAAYRMITNGVSATKPWTGTGNAYNWGPSNVSKTDHSPAVGAVAWWKAGAKGAGSLGHVAYVERVVSSTQIVVSEDNWGGNFDWRVIRSTSGWPTGFIHFDDAGAGSPVGRTDSATSPGSHKLALKGWAFDPDRADHQVSIRVYVGASSAARQRVDLTAAGLRRSDVAAAYPGMGANHGFNQSTKVTKSGRQTVWVYALNKAGTKGKNALLYRGTVTIQA